MPGRIEFEFTTRGSSARGPRETSTPMRILVLGDFSGYVQDGDTPERPAIAQRKPHPVDLDNLDQVLGRFAPAVTLDPGDGNARRIPFSTLDDFHPDSLLQRVPLFDTLRDIRARLRDRNTRAGAAAQLRTLLSLQVPGTPAEERPATAAKPEATENDAATLERLLGKPAGGASHGQNTARSIVERLIGDAVSAHVVPEADAGEQVYLDAADRALAELMRNILHHPAFQALEATWRGIAFLVSRLELDENLQLVLLDVTKEELLQDAAQAGADLAASALYRLLVEQQAQLAGVEPWPLIIGQYSFTHSADDTRLLALLGGIAERTGGPFLAQADAALLGCAALVDTPNPRDWTAVDAADRQRWSALRASPVAPWIGLALPRLLLRLPYGPDSDEIDGFDFTEITDATEHRRFLWGNPALGCTVLLGQAFTDRGRGMTPGDIRDIGDLPAFIHSVDGDRQLLPGAEVYLTETAAERILAQGFMPLVSLRNTNTARLLRFQSIAEPVRALAGAWNPASH